MTGTLLRQTRHFQAYAVERGVRIIARDGRSTPRSRVVSQATWHALAHMNDASFDGSCVLELGIGTWARRHATLKAR